MKITDVETELRAMRTVLERGGVPPEGLRALELAADIVARAGTLEAENRLLRETLATLDEVLGEVSRNWPQHEIAMPHQIRWSKRRIRQAMREGGAE